MERKPLSLQGFLKRNHVNIEPVIKSPNLLEFATPEKILDLFGEGWKYEIPEYVIPDYNMRFKTHRFIYERPNDDYSFIVIKEDTDLNQLTLQIGRGKEGPKMYASDIQHVVIVPERPNRESKHGQHMLHLMAQEARLYFNLGDNPVWVGLNQVIDDSRISTLGISYYPSRQEAVWDMSEKGSSSIQL